MRSSRSSSNQVSVFACTVVYLRYIRDLSLINALFPLLLFSLSKLANKLVSAFFADERRADSELTLKEFLIKTLRLIQVLILAQSIYAVLYHSSIDIKTDVCKFIYGTIFTDIIGEFDCEQRGRGMLFVLDIILLFCQLHVLTDRLTRLENGKQVYLGAFPVEKYGILSIFRTDTSRLRADTMDFSMGPQLHTIYDSEGRSVDEESGYGSLHQR